MLLLLVLNCRGGGLYVICAKSVTQLVASYEVWTGRS